MDVVKGPDNREQLISQWILLYEKDLLRLCCMYLRDVKLAEDAVQETFLKAYKSMDAFRGERGVKPWLVRIAVNVCRDVGRSAWFKMLRNAVELEAYQIAQPEGNFTIRSEVTMEIMRLPRACKEVVLLHYYEGFSQTEIAQTLNVSNTTVHRRLEKAHRLLKDVLKGEEEYA